MPYDVASWSSRLSAVAQAAGRRAGDQLERRGLGRDALAVGDDLQAGYGGGQGDAPEVEALAARDDRRGHLVGLGSREDEDDVRRRLFQRLEQRVEGRVGQHVDFVDQVDLVLAGARREGHLVAQAADLVDAAVGRRVELDEVQSAPGEVVPAGLALIARLAVLAVGAVQRLAQETARTGLAGAARPREQVGVRDAVRRQRVLQRRRDVFLAGEFAEGARAPFAVEDLRHAGEATPDSGFVGPS